PLVTPEVIARVLDAAAQVGAAVPGLPLSDTVKRVDGGGIVRATVPRSETLQGETLAGLTAVQTPQGARAERLLIPPDSALTPGPSPTLRERGEANHKLSPSSILQQKAQEENTPALQSPLSRSVGEGPGVRAEVRTGFGYDVHAFAAPEAGRRLFLGGVEIPHDRGLDGHSDADVLLHAVCDALLGAASLGDIGILFPNTDSAYKNISSLRLLSEVGARLAGDGWEIVNLDATVLAEAPKLMPYRDAMQRAIGDCLRLAPSRISVKATTSEKMGFVGRREGIACWAVATIRSR